MARGRSEPVDLTGRVVVITGANAGIGREAAVQLAGRGATVVLTARDGTKGDEALADVRARSGSSAVEVALLDLASFASIRACAAALLARHDRIHVLVNNAGAILSERAETAEGFEATFGVNHLGHFLLTGLLRERLEASAPARIVNVSSVAHRFALGGLSWADLAHRSRYTSTAAYNESKLANVLFTMGLASRLAGSGVTANACHPGPVRSGFGSADDTSGLERAAMVLAKPFLISPRAGARPLVYLASSPEVASTTGGYFVGGLQPGVHRRRPSKAGRDPVAAERLWALSERLIADADARAAGPGEG